MSVIILSHLNGTQRDYGNSHDDNFKWIICSLSSFCLFFFLLLRSSFLFFLLVWICVCACLICLHVWMCSLCTTSRLCASMRSLHLSLPARGCDSSPDGQTGQTRPDGWELHCSRIWKETTWSLTPCIWFPLWGGSKQKRNKKKNEGNKERIVKMDRRTGNAHNSYRVRAKRLTTQTGK